MGIYIPARVHKLNTMRHLAPDGSRKLLLCVQIANDSTDELAKYCTFLADITGKAPAADATKLRRRIVLCIDMHPKLRPTVATTPAPCLAPPQLPMQVLQLTDGVPVYEWWFGDRGPQAEMKGVKPRGVWRRYHPTVCARIEAALRGGGAFAEGLASLDVDGVRYMIQHITEARPFARPMIGSTPYSGGFPAELTITVQHPCYESIDVLTSNCFVQFHKLNATRCRVARRRTSAEEIARNALRTGEPCMICFSEDGEMTGCSSAHVICSSCLRMSLRSVAGDILTVSKLICGCFGAENEAPILALAARADETIRAWMAAAHDDEVDKMSLSMELTATHSQWSEGWDGKTNVPADLYKTKVTEWFEKLKILRLSPLYHQCQHPSCANRIDRWIKREDFDNTYRLNGVMSWVCPAGHRNSVLPSDDEIHDMNRTVLLHPEYYTEDTSYDHCPLRRFRICRGCVAQGNIMLACHPEGCKQWPGGGSGHTHVFCFSCTRLWAPDDEDPHVCNHHKQCVDPGIQQVRRQGEALEIGMVNHVEYLAWLDGTRPLPPSTLFETAPRTEDGMERQTRLKMLDRIALLAESRKGTSGM